MSNKRVSLQQITNTMIDYLPQEVIERISVHLSPKQCFLFELAMEEFLRRKNQRNLTIDEEKILQDDYYESDDYYENDDYYESDENDYYNQNKSELDDGWIDPNPNIDYDDGYF